MPHKVIDYKIGANVRTIDGPGVVKETSPLLGVRVQLATILRWLLPAQVQVA